MSIKKSTKTSVEYRDIPGFPGYRVGNDGSVWSCKIIGSRPSKNGEKWRKLKPGLAADGRHHVTLSKNGKPFMQKVHRLVLEVFVGPCPPGMECAHWDRNPLNNHLNNLRWTTRKENYADRVRHGTDNSGERSWSAKLTVKQVLEIRRLREQGMKVQTIGDLFGITDGNVSNICKRRKWKHI